jgi:hypothetical protein
MSLDNPLKTKSPEPLGCRGLGKAIAFRFSPLSKAFSADQRVDADKFRAIRPMRDPEGLPVGSQFD